MVDDDPDNPKFGTEPVVNFVTTYLPIPVFLLLIFGYRLINQTTMTQIEDMEFDGVADVDTDGHIEETRPETFWRWLWWCVAY